MSGRLIFDGKYLGETKTYVFDFTSQLAAGETVSTGVVTATVYSGTDSSPSSIVSGSATVATPRVSQAITAGTLGVTYFVICTATTSASQTLILGAYLTVIPNYA